MGDDTSTQVRPRFGRAFGGRGARGLLTGSELYVAQTRQRAHLCRPEVTSAGSRSAHVLPQDLCPAVDASRSTSIALLALLVALRWIQGEVAISVMSYDIDPSDSGEKYRLYIVWHGMARTRKEKKGEKNKPARLTHHQRGPFPKLDFCHTRVHTRVHTHPSPPPSPTKSSVEPVCQGSYQASWKRPRFAQEHTHIEKRIKSKLEAIKNKIQSGEAAESNKNRITVGGITSVWGTT
ncbi:uncharacterized protein LY79DRAFT_204482 [Colletotrichum navitas]|uniref:Uncharacterized protein n=1 Tax=Colletotrichum navitas TaxID=681940 RepID=A0AAD8QAY2_9PEZI|nr:uncharacterized protein LY79DRAFT_204482 [Colletotrichum navitas]KAK1598975.1 hypothetical protein LY79DRAFT_204482 [Colletotrichum navitas]